MKRLLVLRISVLTLVAVAAWHTKFPSLDSASKSEILSSFAFKKSTISETSVTTDADKFLELHPRLDHIKGYVSAFAPVGAALFDVDGNGLPDEFCYADALQNKAMLMPTPNKSQKFAAIDLIAPPTGKEFVPTSCTFGDFNEDSLPDILLTYWGRTPVIFTNITTDPSQPAFRPREVVSPPRSWFTNTATQSDIDGDGHVDLVFANYYPDNSGLFDKSGKGDVEMNDSFAISWNGERNKLLIWQSTTEVDGYQEATFSDRSDSFPEAEATQWSVAMGFADLNEDGLQELYIANDHGWDRFYLNRSTPGNPKFSLIEGKRGFETPKSKVIGKDAFHGMGVDFADVTGDDNFEILISNFTADYLMHESHFVWSLTGFQTNDGIKTPIYKDVAESLGMARSGWAWDVKAEDFNNDGSKEVMQAVGLMRGKINRTPEIHEVALGNDSLLKFPEVWPKLVEEDDWAGQRGNAFFVKGPTGRYFDIGNDLNFNEDGLSRALATGDTNGDGQIDVLVTNHRTAAVFYENAVKSKNTFLGLDIRLTYNAADASTVQVKGGRASRDPGTRAAFGAMVKVKMPDGKVRKAFVDGGNGYVGKRDSGIHMGLGQLDDKVQLSAEISWRDHSGKLQSKEVQVTPGWNTLILGSNIELGGLN
jgi:hypothetical protein